MTIQEKADLFDEFVERARSVITDPDFEGAMQKAMLIARHLADSKGHFKITVRDPEEIQRAHDLLILVATWQIDLGYPKGVRDNAHLCADVLCWVLRHKHSQAFADNIKQIEDEARRRGYVIAEGKP